MNKKKINSTHTSCSVSAKAWSLRLKAVRQASSRSLSTKRRDKGCACASSASWRFSAPTRWLQHHKVSGEISWSLETTLSFRLFVSLLLHRGPLVRFVAVVLRYLSHLVKFCHICNKSTAWLHIWHLSNIGRLYQLIIAHALLLKTARGLVLAQHFWHYVKTVISSHSVTSSRFNL